METTTSQTQTIPVTYCRCGGFIGNLPYEWVRGNTRSFCVDCAKYVQTDRHGHVTIREREK